MPKFSKNDETLCILNSAKFSPQQIVTQTDNLENFGSEHSGKNLVANSSMQP